MKRKTTIYQKKFKLRVDFEIDCGEQTSITMKLLSISCEKICVEFTHLSGS